MIPEQSENCRCEFKIFRLSIYTLLLSIIVLIFMQIKRRFENSSLKQRARTAHAYEFKRDFGQVLASQMVSQAMDKKEDFLDLYFYYCHFLSFYKKLLPVKKTLGSFGNIYRLQFVGVGSPLQYSEKVEIFGPSLDKHLWQQDLGCLRNKQERILVDVQSLHDQKDKGNICSVLS